MVYGSRFLDRRPDAPPLTIAANRFLTWLTNVLYGASLTDMETCYKIMRADVVRGLTLTADRFDIEPEITARLLLAAIASSNGPRDSRRGRARPARRSAGVTD